MMNNIPDFLKEKKPSVLEHPLLKFSYGIIYFSIGLIYWQTGALIEYYISININPLLGIMITGMSLVAGFYYLTSYYDESKKIILHKIQSQGSISHD